jgi:hypothetical protein
MGDLLSAASLLLAVVGIFFGLWYGEISEALFASVPRHKEDRTATRQRVRAALLGRALPIALAAVPSALIFIPDGVAIIAHSVKLMSADVIIALKAYDAVRTAFVFVVLLLCILGGYATVLALRLNAKLGEIDK